MKAILTGHSRGLGAALASQLLERGIPVLALARAHNAELAQRHPQLLQQQALDLADAGAVQQWLADGQLQGFLADAPAALLINNAGMVQPVGPMSVQAGADVARAISLNISTPLMLAAALCQVLPAQEKRVVHISSGAGRTGYAGWSVYCASKAALDNHARAAMLDAVPGLRICSLAPGVIDTDMQAEIRSAPQENFPMRERFLALKREGNLSSPEDCARKLLAYVLGPAFGKEAVADLREVGG
jgi:NAD(P)-dependent dehydrogenase (short-subunit alcohol dehydrogenase family)